MQEATTHLEGEMLSISTWRHAAALLCLLTTCQRRQSPRDPYLSGRKAVKVVETLIDLLPWRGHWHLVGEEQSFVSPQQKLFHQSPSIVKNKNVPGLNLHVVRQRLQLGLWLCREDLAPGEEKGGKEANGKMVDFSQITRHVGCELLARTLQTTIMSLYYRAWLPAPTRNTP